LLLLAILDWSPQGKGKAHEHAQDSQAISQCDASALVAKEVTKKKLFGK
jgi:hypothetical protein